MNIIYSNNFAYLRGGAEQVLFEEMDLLREHGHRTTLFSRAHPQNDTWESQTYFPPHFEYNSKSIFNKVMVAKELVYSMTAKIKFQQLINQESPDLIHAHNIYGRLTTSIFDAAVQEGLPIVLTLHDYKLLCPAYLFFRNGKICELCLEASPLKCITKRCHKDSLIASAVYVAETYFNKLFNKYGQISYFLCPSHFMLNKQASAGLSRKKLVYLPNTIDTTHIAVSNDNNAYILFAGRLSREKGVNTLFSAMIGLNIPLKIVGDGPLRRQLEKAVDERGLKQVTFEGYKRGGELAALFKDASFLVFPSECYENAPLAILEAYGHGKPVIGSDLGGIPEMIVDGETGSLFPHGDSDSLREKIVAFWKNPVKTAQMGRAARDRVEKHYNSELHYRKLMEVYQKALS